MFALACAQWAGRFRDAQNVVQIAMVQAVRTNNVYGVLNQAGFQPYDSPVFVDGTQHLKQNLLYELRAATISQQGVTLSDPNLWYNPFFSLSSGHSMLKTNWL